MGGGGCRYDGLPSKAQSKYLLVFQDLFTRWIEVKPLRKADGKAVSRAIEELRCMC